MADEFLLVDLSFPGEVHFHGDRIIVGDTDVTEVMRSALGGSPSLHGRMVLQWYSQPLVIKTASSTMGSKFREAEEPQPRK